ncbi:M67 family metallopeptidase [Sphingomonas sp. 35-24ZXX]|uniref:M67 family metallopeptidase n=1 Tax=Sphingomonas sp. 35-24ZXX TaxID=1545915 RepID=UPI00053BFB97|nr:M67 family metallopeptidase [Sphingomonas sp. 35-24ZXX]
MPVLLSSALHAQLLAHAAATHPVECCGLLLGSDGAIETVQACPNVADDPATGFEIDPATLIAAERAMRQGGKRLIGHYHSHPNGRSAPSPRDAASAAADGRLWLIIAGGEITAWRAVSGGALHGAFDPVALRLSDG